jgi:hypothetical protein
MSRLRPKGQPSTWEARLHAHAFFFRHFILKTAVGPFGTLRLPRKPRRSGRTDSHPTGDNFGAPFVLRLSKHERANGPVTAVFRFMEIDIPAFIDLCTSFIQMDTGRVFLYFYPVTLIEARTFRFLLAIKHFGLASTRIGLCDDYKACRLHPKFCIDSSSHASFLSSKECLTMNTILLTATILVPLGIVCALFRIWNS